MSRLLGPFIRLSSNILPLPFCTHINFSSVSLLRYYTYRWRCGNGEGDGTGNSDGVYPQLPLVPFLDVCMHGMDGLKADVTLFICMRRHSVKSGFL